MVPGMGHCGGGNGPNNFDAFSALESWVEKGVAPTQLIGTGTVVGDSTKKMTRPICAYPEISQYKGTGDPNDAANFMCATPSR
jgi:feruloyl esterase